MPVVEISERTLEEGARLIRAGQLVAFPTETVYGLGADATNSTAVAALYAAKGRPRFNPLIAHVPDNAAAHKYVEFRTRPAEALAEAFWPGPLTLVLPRRADSHISDLVTAGLDTVAIRVPKHPVARDLLARAGVPVAAPSANLSGHVSPTTAQHVAHDLSAKVAMILDGGPTEHGLESTVVEVMGEKVSILRPGALTAKDIEAVIGGPVARSLDSGSRPRSPGQLESHYAPHAAVRMNATTIGAGEALLAFGPNPPVTVGPMINLSPKGNLVEAAANLFAALRALDKHGVNCIAVTHIPDAGLGEAINDRLKRAAAGR